MIDVKKYELLSLQDIMGYNTVARAERDFDLQRCYTQYKQEAEQLEMLFYQWLEYSGYITLLPHKNIYLENDEPGAPYQIVEGEY